MRYKKTAAALSLIGLSALLAACDAITAQHISSSTTTAFNNGAGLGGRGAQMGMPGGFTDAGGLGGMIDGVVDEAFDADVIGRIAEVDGNTVRLELLKQGASSAGGGAYSPGGAADGQTDWTATGESLTLTLGNEVRISSVSSAASGEGSRGSGGRRGGAQGDSNAAMPEGGRSGNGMRGGAPTDGAGNPPSADTPSAPSATGSITDLKSGQIVMIWYKEGTKTVDRIRILSDSAE